MAGETYYELLYITDPGIKEPEVGDAFSKAEDLILKNGGSIMGKSDLGNRLLAYPIKKFRQGRYLLINFDMGSEKVGELNRGLKLLPLVIRHTIGLKPKSFLEFAEKYKQKIIESASINRVDGLEEESIRVGEEVKAVKENESKESFSMEELDKKLEEILNN